MKGWGIAILVAAVLGAYSAQSLAGSTDPCSSQNLYAARLRLEAPLAALKARYPWIKDAATNCATARMGAQSEQAATAQSCLASACGRAASCPSDIAAVLDAVKANSLARDQYSQQQKQCKTAAPQKGPLEGYFDLMLAETDGDATKVRNRASGADSEVAQEFMVAELGAAITEFSKAAKAASDPTSAGLGRLIVSVSSAPSKQAEEFLLYHEVLKSPTMAIIQSGSSATVAEMVLEKGQWKQDFSDEPAANSTALLQIQLLSYGIKYAAEVLEDKRSSSPFWVAAYIQACFQMGQFRLLASIEAGTSDCRRMFESRFGAPPAATSAPTATASSPAATQSATAAASAGSAAELSQASARVDEVFIRWSRSWFTDRYMAGSARAASMNCSSDECRAAGGFQFTRGITTIAASFDALLQKQPNGDLAVRKLCYNDPSSGSGDCVQ